MTRTLRKLYTFAEYLVLEENATEKHEFYKGEIFVRSGGTSPHNIIAVNIVSLLHSALRPHPCLVYSSDMRVRIESVDYATYGDAMVICGEVQYYKNRTDVVTNPLLILEVLSPSTRKFDQTTKFELYRYLPSFEHYLIVDSDRSYVEYHQKIGEKWSTTYYRDLIQTVHLQLPHADLELPLARIYEKVEVINPALPRISSKKPKSKND
jgi:Uma2 family endonuclease